MCNFYTYPNTDALVSCLSSKTSLVCIPDKAIVIWQALKQQVKPKKNFFCFLNNQQKIPYNKTIQKIVILNISEYSSYDKFRSTVCASNYVLCSGSDFNH